jgi:hypothetical protein
LGEGGDRRQEHRDDHHPTHARRCRAQGQGHGLGQANGWTARPPAPRLLHLEALSALPRDGPYLTFTNLLVGRLRR